jgi:hypothetical protein
MVNSAPAVDPADAAAEAAFADRNKMLKATPPVDPRADAAADAAAEAAFSGRPSATTGATGEQTWGATIKDLPYQFGQGMIEGGAGLLGAPAGIAHGINRLFGIPAPVEDPKLGFQNAFTPSDLLSKAKGTGYYDPTQPDTLTGQVVRGLGQSTPALPLGPLGGLGAKANLAYTYLPSAVGDIFHHYTDQNPLWASLPSALTLSGLERIFTQGAAKSAATAAAAKAAQEQAAAEAALKAHAAMQPATSEMTTLQRQGAANVVQSFKEGSLADIAKAHDAEYTAADADREDIAASLGTSDTIQKGGEALQDAARSWKKTEFPKALKDAEEQMYKGAVNIPEDAGGDLTNFRDSLANSFYKAGDLEPAAQQLKSRMPERLESALDAIGAKQGLKPGEVPAATLNDMKKLRSILGDAMTSPKLSEGVDAGRMNELYRALSSDMEAAISKAAGPQGVIQFKKFNEEARRLYGLASGPVGDIIKSTDPLDKSILPGDAVAKTLAGSDKDGSRLTQLASEPTLKKGLDEMAASQLRTGKGPGVVQGDPDKFFTGLAPESKTALFGDVTAGKLQDTIDRRAAADQTRDQMTKDVGKGVKDIKQSAAADIAGQTRVRGEKTIALEQEESARKAALQEAQAKMKDVHTAKPMSWENIPWGRVLAGLGGLTAGHHLLPQELASQLPNWGERAVDLATMAGSYVTAKGAHEMIHNPQARKNLLQAGTTTAGTRPDVLGWGVGENK